VSDRKDLKKVIIMTAVYYQRDLNPDVLAMMADDLAEFDEQETIAAYKAYRNNPKNRTFPLPAQIIGIMKPEPDSRDVANELARKMYKAIIVHGYPWQEGYFSANGQYWLDDKHQRHSSFKDAVISELGEVGWHVICSRGDWIQFRNSANMTDESAFIAQLRDQIQSSQNLIKQGFDVSKITMPVSKDTRNVQLRIQGNDEEPRMLEKEDQAIEENRKKQMNEFLKQFVNKNKMETA
jgi:hypothetical protein